MRKGCLLKKHILQFVRISDKSVTDPQLSQAIQSMTFSIFEHTLGTDANAWYQFSYRQVRADLEHLALSIRRDVEIVQHSQMIYR